MAVGFSHVRALFCCGSHLPWHCAAALCFPKFVPGLWSAKLIITWAFLQADVRRRTAWIVDRHLAGGGRPASELVGPRAAIPVANHLDHFA
jgi:hypothetical protein